MSLQATNQAQTSFGRDAVNAINRFTIKGARPGQRVMIASAGEQLFHLDLNSNFAKLNGVSAARLNGAFLKVVCQANKMSIELKSNAGKIHRFVLSSR